METGSLVKRTMGGWIKHNPWMANIKQPRIGIVLAFRCGFARHSHHKRSRQRQECKVFIDNNVSWIPKDSLETICK